MKKSILIGLIALGLVACSDNDNVNDQPTDAVTVDAPAVEEAPAVEASAEVEVVEEAPAAE